MTTTRHVFDPPIDPNLPCDHCGDKLLAVAQIRDGGMTISGLAQYQWTHAHGSAQCRIVRTARPYDGWQATACVKAVENARMAAEDALLDALEGDPR
jgi:hypothetical protein